MPFRRLCLFLLLIALASPAAVFSLTSEDAAALYQRFGEALYSPAVALPAGGVTLRHGDAVWVLESGQLRYQQPTGDGVVTGLVFEGHGRFRLAVADPQERTHLRRLTDGRLDGGDVPFTEMVLRTTVSLFDGLPPAPAGGHTPDELARKRHHHWLDSRREDVDARVVCGLLMPGDVYLRAGMKTEGFDWLTYEYDSLVDEEVVLAHYDPQESFLEEWVRIDRAEDRDPHGRPGRVRRRLIDLEHLDVTVDLSDAAKRLSPIGAGQIQPRIGRFRVELRFVPQVDGATALPLELSNLARVTRVATPEGRELGFLRHQLDKTVSVIDFKSHDRDLVVLLDRPLERGQERRLVVEYDREVLNYVPGGDWYPAERNPFIDRHTAHLEIRTRPRDDVRAMGRLVEEREEDGVKTWVWEVERPARMVTFSFAEKFFEETIEVEGVPEVIAFASYGGTKVKNKAFNVAADLSNSINYFQQLFDYRLPSEKIYATGILGNHGQSFDGFIHLAEDTFQFESTRGYTEAFRAHEAAHQWWGHTVAWKSYRDQWLSEAFAEYSALMFVQVAMDKGQERFDEILELYVERLVGDKDDKVRQRLGPISLGYRASTADLRGGYFIQTYTKGAVVLHMLRTMLRSLTKSDDVFVRVLRDFIATHAGTEASTDDFAAILAKNVSGNPWIGDWSWFFDQWIHGTAIPTYLWSYEVTSRDGQTVVDVEVEQSDVPETFRMPVPIRIDFGNGKEGQVVMLVDQPHKTLSIPLPQKPKAVDFNPDNAVLARVKKQ